MSSHQPNPGSRIPVPFALSQSSLQDYFDCPRRFFLRYIEQMIWPAVESEPVAEYERRQQEGLLFHRLVQQHLLGLPPEKLRELASGPDLQRWWQNYVSSDLGLAGSTLHTELTLSSPIGQHRILAKYDLVAVRDGQATIFDWKTYARRPREEQMAARWQTRIYRLLLAKAGAHLNGGMPFQANQIQMIYWFAEFPSEAVRFRYDEGQLARDWSALETIVNEITSAGTFPLTDDQNMCRFCVYRSYCDRGRQAARWTEAETDSEGERGFDLNFDQIAEIEF
jgi:CRISPR/Cas system-associated exonuclease Cas4 (RecB family)